MKFKYIGEDNRFSPELIAYKLQSEDYLKHGEIIDVPDDLESIIKGLEINGLFIPVIDDVKVKKEKK